MTTTKQPTALGASILEAIMLSSADQKAVYEALGISYNTFRKRLASDGFTVNQIMCISNVTGISVGAIIPRQYLESHAA